MRGDHSPAAVDHRIERLTFFSDAVFAIAITLLVIEIHVPHLAGSGKSAGAALRELAPSIFGFVASFLAIGRFWMGHHAALARVDSWRSELLWPNLLLLMAIAFMPFATGFMSANLGETVPMAFYCSVLLLTAILSAWVVRLATRAWATAIDPAGRRILNARALAIILAVSLALVLAFVTPVFNILAIATSRLWQRLIERTAYRDHAA